MKRIIEETEHQGLESLLGEQVLILCIGYFYTGKLVGVNESCIELADPSVVFDLGKWNESTYATVEKISFAKTLFIQISAIESFTVSK